MEFVPAGWTGKTGDEQRELFDQILMYIMQAELSKI
jgi:hypothetical protein